MIRFKALLLILTLFSIQSLKAQQCLQNLYDANKMLIIGNSDGCLALIKTCSSKGNDESIRWQAYRLMSQAYLLKGNTDSAQINAEAMLDLNPTYRPDVLNDPKEFITILSKIVVIPKFSLGLAFSIGTNSSFPEVRQGYIVANYEKKYSRQNSFQFGTNLGFSLSPNLLLEIGLLSTSKQFAIDYSFDDWKVTINQRLTYFDFPITAKYVFRSDKSFRLFLSGGAFGGYLLRAENDFFSTQTSTAETFELAKLNSNDRYHKLNFGLTSGLGAIYKIGAGHVSIQCNYFHSFVNITKSNNRYNYNELIYTYFFVDDDLRVHNLALSMGYTLYLNYKVYRKK